MSEKKTLQDSVNKMKEGSEKGFHAFFHATVQYAYSLAFHLFGDETSAKDFLSDFYIYLYLHISDYRGEGDEKDWINRNLLARYQELSIGKNLKSIRELSFEGEVAPLDEASVELIYGRLKSSIKFPPEERKHRNTGTLLLVFALLGAVVLGVLFFTRMSGNASVPEKHSEVVSAEDIMEELEQNSTDAGEQDTGSGNTTTINVIHDNENSGETTRVTPESVSEPETPQVNTPSAPQSGEEAVPAVNSPSVETPSVDTPSTPSVVTPPAGGSGSSDPEKQASDAEDAIEDFLKEVEEFQNYDLS